MVNLVYFLVKRWPMHEAMHVIMVEILKNEKDGDLNSHVCSITDEKKIFSNGIMISILFKTYMEGKGAETFIPKIVAIGWKKKIKGPSKTK